MRLSQSRPRWDTALLVIALIFTNATPALAGMPSYDLTDLAKARFEAISFFALGFLIFTLLIMWLWNATAREFPRLPRLTYRRALSLTLLWGLLFLLVLTMISGARELLTPGAWEKKGATYKLKDAGDGK